MAGEALRVLTPVEFVDIDTPDAPAMDPRDAPPAG